MPHPPAEPGVDLPADPSPEPAPDDGRRPPGSLSAHDLQNPGDVSPSSSKQSCSSSLADSRSDPARTPHPHRRHPYPLPGTTQPVDKPATTTTPGNTSSSASMPRSPPPTAVTSSPSLTRCRDPDTTRKPSTCAVGKTSSPPPAPPGSPTPPTSPPPPSPRSRTYPTSPAPTTTKISTLPSPESASTSRLIHRV